METVKGPTLYLNEISAENLTDDVMAWFDDEELMKFYTSSKKKITKEGLMASIADGEEKGNMFTFGIFTNEDNTLIGTIKLGPINFIHRTSDLVALIGNRNYLGKGLSVEAIKLGNQLAFEQYNIRKLYGGMYMSNIPSIKAYTRADWLVEGRLTGQYVVDGKPEDRLLVACFNPDEFSVEELTKIKENEHRYFQL